MVILARRLTSAVGLLAAGGCALWLWATFVAPPGFRVLITGSSTGLLTGLAGGVLHVLAVAAGCLLLGAIPLAAVRSRSRRERARPGRLVCMELRLGREDHASPYEVSKIFDGLAGVLRPSPARRLLRGAETLTLKLVSRPGTGAVRFLIQAPKGYQGVIAARLRASYPDTKLTPLDPGDTDPLGLAGIAPPLAVLRRWLGGERRGGVGVEVLRLKKARRWVWALATTKDYEHAPVESLLSVMHDLSVACQVELVLTPAPGLLERYAGRIVRRRERGFIGESHLGPAEPGVESVVAQKHLKGAVEGVGRAWWWFDYRILVPQGHEHAARHVAGVVQETRAENHLRARVMRPRRRLYAWRSARGLPPLFPALYTGALSSSELASLWQLPSLRLKNVPLHRVSAREILASAAISRDPRHAVMRDERGPLGLHPVDRRKGWLVLGASGAGKTAALAPYAAAIAKDDSRALVIVDPKEDFARLSLALVPTRRTVHYLDLGAPRYGLNILASEHLAPEIRADIFIAVIRELLGESAIGPRSDLFLRAAIQAVTIVEPVPALQHVKALLDPFDSGYREWVTRELRYHHEIDFVRDYWQHTFPLMVKHNSRFVAEAVSAPTNKIGRFLASPSLNLLMTHPVQLDLEGIIRRREILIVNGSKGAVGEDNANVFCSMLVVLLQRALHQMQRSDAGERVQTALIIDEAHNVFIPSFATLLSEGRSGGIEVTAALQYTGQINDEQVKAGIRSLLQNISIFRERDFEDARATAALAMEVFQDSIRGEVEDQRRIRLDPMDIVNQPDHRAVNLWLAHGVPQPAFTADTEPMERLANGPAATRAREHHKRSQQRRGYHPHDEGRYIQPPLVRSIHEPVIARFRTLHIDLAGWPACLPVERVERVTVVFHPEAGAPLGLDAHPEDATGRHYTATLPENPDSIAWLPAGRYRLRIHVWADGEPAPRVWASTHSPRGDGIPLAVRISEEPQRPQATLAVSA